MKKLLTAISLLAGLFPNAQTDTTLDAVTVTGTIGPSKTSATGRNVFVIAGSALRDLPVHSIDELLRFVPGMEVQSRGPMGAQSDIVMRGGTFQQVLVLVDGIRVNDPITAHFNSYIPVAHAEIDRIEILKGPASALYGSDAVGGVIHVITKTFARNDTLRKTVAGLRYTMGEHQLHSGEGGFYAASDKWSLAAGAVANHSDGIPQRGTTGYFHNNTASISAGYLVNEHLRLSLRSSYDDRRFSAQNFYTTFLSDTAKENVSTLWEQMSIRYQRKRSVLTLDAGYKATDDEYAFNNVAIANKNKSSLSQIQLRLSHRLSDATAWNAGIQWVGRGIRSNDRGDHNETQATAFTQLHFQLGHQFNILPAIRLDWNEHRGSELVSQISVSYGWNAVAIRGSAGKTIRDADFTERYNNYNKPTVASGRIGNPDLQAETAVAYELGADYFPNRNFKAAVSFFERQHSGLIDYAPTPYADMPRKSNLVPGGTYALAKNLSDVKITGAELDLQYHRMISNAQSLMGSIGLVFADASSNEQVSSFYLSSFANFLGNIQLRYSHERFSVGLTGLYKERTSQQASAIAASLSSDYFVMNGKLELNLLQKKAAIFVQVDNIFDVSYSDLLGAQMPGRWLMGGFRINFRQ